MQFTILLATAALLISVPATSRTVKPIVIPSEQATLIAELGAKPNSEIRMSSDGEHIAVGTCEKFASSSLSEGRVFVFTRTPDGWGVPAIVSGSPGKRPTFGCSVAISGHLLVVGEPNCIDCGSSNALGGLHVFMLREGKWTQTATIGLPTTKLDGVDTSFGEHLAIHGNDIIASAKLVTNFNFFFIRKKTYGSVWIFTRRGDDWLVQDSLERFDIDTSRDSIWGESLAVSGDRLAVGVSNSITDTQPASGQVLIYRYRKGRWDPDGLIQGPDGEPDFGRRFHLVGEELLVYGLKRGVQLFRLEAGTPTLVNEFSPPPGTTLPASNAVLCGAKVAIKEPVWTPDDRRYQGHVQLWRRNGNDWIDAGWLVPAETRSGFVDDLVCVDGDLFVANSNPPRIFRISDPWRTRPLD